VNVARNKLTVVAGSKDAPRKGGGGNGAGMPATDWRAQLVYGRDGEVKATAHNLLLILEHDPQLGALFAMNAFENRICLRKDAPWPGAVAGDYRETDATRLCAWLGHPERYRMNPKPELVNAAVLAMAEAASFHPVREYLDGLQWDERERIPTLFADYFGVADTEYARHVALAFCISAVARIYNPGCQVDFMLVLEGAQGAGKTRATNALFGDELYAEAMESPQHKDFYIGLLGKWGVEIGEMHAFSKADTTKVKQAVTARFDHYRPPYARSAQSFPRQCVFIGTTNETDWQRDSTGGRRYYPIRVGDRIDLAALRDLRDLIWAEAAARFKRDEPWWIAPPGAAEQQEDRYQEDSWSDPIHQWLCGKDSEDRYPRDVCRPCGLLAVDRVSTSDILSWALRIDFARHTRGEQNRVGSIMRKLGWDSIRVEHAGSKRRIWVRPPPF
jgi:predicted P-loop ATPase